MENLTPIIVLVVAVLAIGFIWRIVTGIIRLILTLGVIAVGIYLIWLFLQTGVSL